MPRPRNTHNSVEENAKKEKPQTLLSGLADLFGSRDFLKTVVGGIVGFLANIAKTLFGKQHERKVNKFARKAETLMVDTISETMQLYKEAANARSTPLPTSPQPMLFSGGPRVQQQAAAHLSSGLMSTLSSAVNSVAHRFGLSHRP